MRHVHVMCMLICKTVETTESSKHVEKREIFINFANSSKIFQHLEIISRGSKGNGECQATKQCTK